MLAIIAEIGTGGGQGYVLEYRGNVIENLSMEARMTVCNMSIEAGARAGMIAPDETTFEYLKGRDHAPPGPTGTRPSPTGASCAPTTTPCSTPRWTSTPTRSPRSSPGAPTPARGCRWPSACPTRSASSTRTSASPPRRRWPTWAWPAGTPLRDIARRHRVRRLVHQRPDRGPARRRRDHATAARSPTACGCSSCPARCGCGSRPRQEGLDKIFTAAGAEWRSAGCSMCLGMNPDQLAPGER